MKAKIGCIAIVDRQYNHGYSNEYLTIDCAKGRGIILPGGKYEEDDQTFERTAERELYEETGVVGVADKLVFHGMAPDGYYVYCFTMKDVSYHDIKEETDEGLVLWSFPSSVLFNPFYELLFECIG
jgi:8-oxo-dGTP pyrophosphatase MutT (NUDIX family)